ncbi:metal ABC transporter ATP-binding protein [Dehalococcoidia bacterium]|nr:metal ABC transporter ATP-binding protein [Dehalococcoidia bacterium]
MTNPVEMVVELKTLSYAYGDTLAVNDVTMQVATGDFVAIVGPNGSGKSTLVKLALGLLKPTKGSSRLLGIHVEHFSQWHKIGYVPQVSKGVHAQLPMTVGEVVSHGRYSGVSPLAFWRTTIGADVEDALDTVGSRHLKERRIGELSPGQQQRILVARALVRKPQVLMLDEPIGGVDVHGEEQLYALLRRLNNEGITIIMVSHDIGAVMREAKTVACMNQTLVFHGRPHELTRDELARLYGFPVEVLLHDALHEHR